MPAPGLHGSCHPSIAHCTRIVVDEMMLVMMRWPVLLQMCTKQGFMPADVLSEATRHAERLVELAPGNPASHELRSYVHMHDAQQDLDVACRYAIPCDCHLCLATSNHITVCKRLPQGPSMWLKHASHKLHATNVQTVLHNEGCTQPKGDSDSTNDTFPLDW